MADVGDEGELPLYVHPVPHGLPPGSPSAGLAPGPSAGAGEGALIAPRPAGFTPFLWVLPARAVEALMFALSGLAAVGFVVAGDWAVSASEVVAGVLVGLVLSLVLPRRRRPAPGGRGAALPTQAAARATTRRAWYRRAGLTLLGFPLAVAAACAVAPPVAGWAAWMLLTAGLVFGVRAVRMWGWQRRERLRLLQAFGQRSWWHVEVREAVTHVDHVLFEGSGLVVTGSTPAGVSEPLSLSVRMLIAVEEGRPREAVQLGASAYRCPDVSLAYNVACYAAVAGDVELGLAWLDRAVWDGWWDVRALRRDPQLASLRASPRFAGFAPRVEANVQALGIAPSYR